MYYPNREIEDICYKGDHIEKVLCEMKNGFPRYFDQFLETEAGNKISGKKHKEIAKELGNTKSYESLKLPNQAAVFKRIISEAINEFEKDRPTYKAILDLEALDEYDDDPSNFKNSVLKNTCPIIRVTLQNKRAKELDKYRAEFSNSDPNDLLTVVKNLTNFAIDYLTNTYDKETYEKISQLKEMCLSDLDGDNYTVYGVIGGGIKSHFLYKLNPSVFPNRNQESIWALWYLTDKKTFDCVQDSEFLMLDLNKNKTQQNYFYPYELFAFYAYHIYLLLKKEANKYDIQLDKDYRYVLVHTFLSFIANLHSEDIDLLKSSDSEDGYGY